MIGTSDKWKSLPQGWQAEVAAQLRSDETLLGWFEPDLDLDLNYAQSLVVLTDRRLLAPRADEAQPNSNGNRQHVRWEEWLLRPDLHMQSREHAGVGLLDLIDSSGRLGNWRYTAGRSASAHRFAQRFNASRIGPAESGVAVIEQTVCPRCGAVITSEDGECTNCTPKAAPPTASSLYRLMKFALPRAKMVLLGLCLTFASTIVGSVPLILTQPLIDNVLFPYEKGEHPDFSLAYWYLGGLAAATLVAWFVDWGRTFVLAYVSERVAADLRSQTYAHLQRLSLEFFGGKRTGDLMSRIGNDTDRICDFLTLNLVDFVTDCCMIAITGVILLSWNWRLALLTICPFPLIVWMVYAVRLRLRRNFRRGAVAWAEMTSVLADTIPGIRVVKAFAQERREVERFYRSNARVLEANDRINLIWSFFGPLVTLLTDFGLLAVWAFGTWQVFKQNISVGTLVMFVSFLSRIYTRVESMINMVPATQRAATSAQRIFEIMDRVPSVAEPTRPVRPGRLEGALELRNVRFKYGTREVLHGVNLHIRPGEMIGLVGASGAGKSTLVNLVCRFYDVAEGAILADGVDIRSFPVEEYRRNIGIVLQEPFLFFGTIAENIAYGRPDASREQIVAAARAARAHEFILRLPDGYDSVVGERGQALSGGERQRISIARALLIDPRLLILDEATSSVDTETERDIQSALENLITGRTTIAIAHRLSTLRRADRLVVLDRGEIVEIGNHHDLLKIPGHYARLHRAQLELAHGLGT